MTSRLDTVDGALRLLLGRASVRQQRAAATAAAVHVVLVTRLRGDRVDAAMRLVRDRRADPDLAKTLAEEAAALDGKAFLLRERADESESEAADGHAMEPAYAEEFARARAAAALSWALATDSEQAAVEAVYEAYLAMGTMGALRHLVEHAMSVASSSSPGRAWHSR